MAMNIIENVTILLNLKIFTPWCLFSRKVTQCSNSKSHEKLSKLVWFGSQDFTALTYFLRTCRAGITFLSYDFCGVLRVEVASGHAE